jgi:hypothetical protein
MYNSLVEKCFSTCVQSFRRKTLEKDEERVRTHPQLSQEAIFLLHDKTAQLFPLLGTELVYIRV